MPEMPRPRNVPECEAAFGHLIRHLRARITGDPGVDPGEACRGCRQHDRTTGNMTIAFTLLRLSSLLLGIAILVVLIRAKGWERTRQAMT